MSSLMMLVMVIPQLLLLCIKLPQTEWLKTATFIFIASLQYGMDLMKTAPLCIWYLQGQLKTWGLGFSESSILMSNR